MTVTGEKNGESRSKKEELGSQKNARAIQGNAKEGEERPGDEEEGAGNHSERRRSSARFFGKQVDPLIR